jgi:hypothetical protein
MKARTEVILGLVLLAVLFGVGLFAYQARTRNPLPLFRASVDRDCAPWDGSAFRISIPLDSGSVIEVSIWRSPDLQAPIKFSFPDPTLSAGEAVLRSRFGSSEPLTGSITFWRLGADDPLEGDFNFAARGGERFSGGFKAEWRNRAAYCG